MAKAQSHAPDYVLAGLMFFLIAFGLVMLSSAGVVVGMQRYGHAEYFLLRQLIFLGIGLVGFYFFYKVDYHVWRRYALPLLVMSIILLVLVFVPGIGFRAGGANRWIALGSFLLQPSEIIKLTFLIYLAAWLENRGKGISNLSSGLVPFLTVLGVIVVLVMKQPDMGTVSVIVLLSMVVYFTAGAPMTHMIGMVASIGALGLAFIKLSPYRAARLSVFLNPGADPNGAGYHINQALLAIGTGGLFGLGLGNSVQKHNFLPEVTGDSIFAVIAEELGFILVVALILVFLYFLRRGLRVAQHAPDAFGQYVAVGIATSITAQALINIAALSGLIPLTGITLPFISSGGSSLIVSMSAVGLLLNISTQTKG